MRSIKIIADSGSNLNERLCREIDAVSVPLTLTVDGRDFVDTFDLDVAEFLEAVEASPNVARSACPSRQPMRRNTRAPTRCMYSRCRASCPALTSLLWPGRNWPKTVRMSMCLTPKSACGGPALQAIKLRSLLDQGLSKSEVTSDDRLLKTCDAFCA